MLLFQHYTAGAGNNIACVSSPRWCYCRGCGPQAKPLPGVRNGVRETFKTGLKRKPETTDKKTNMKLRPILTAVAVLATIAILPSCCNRAQPSMTPAAQVQATK
jgi:hypothetical protein